MCVYIYTYTHTHIEGNMYTYHAISENKMDAREETYHPLAKELISNCLNIVSINLS